MLTRFAAAVVLCAVLAATTGRAQEPRVQRLLAQAATEQDLGLLERVLGQLSDLPASVEVRIVNAQGLDARAEAASNALKATHVDGVLWLTDLPGKKLLFLSRPNQEPMLVARMPVGKDGELASSDQEMAALIVRSAVQALAAGATPPHVAAAHDERPCSTRPSHQTTALDESCDDATLRLRAILAAQQWIDGSGGAGRTGGLLQVEALWDLLRVDVEGSLSWPKRVDTALGGLRIARHDAAVAIGLQVPTRWVTASLSAHAGTAFFVRSTLASDQLLVATSTRTTPAFFVGPEARASWDWGAVGMGLLVALDVMPGPPTFKFAGSGAPQTPAYKPPVISARVALGLQVRML